MVNAKEITKYLNSLLNIEDFEDKSVNGLQVENIQEIKKAAFAVDMGLETVQKANALSAQMLIVHHGLIWSCLRTITGLDYKKIRELIKTDIALYAAHLPLDAHPKYGNNAVLSRILELKKTKPFGVYSGKKIGVIGETNLSLEQIQKKLSEKGMKNELIAFGKTKIRKAAIISGRAAFEVKQAIDEGADIYITGEPLHEMYHIIKEGQINVMFAGHYETEVWGVKELAKLVKKRFGISTEFIDIPTSI